jgi:hypothetical protein
MANYLKLPTTRLTRIKDAKKTNNAKKMNKVQKKEPELKGGPLILLFKFIQNENHFFSCCVLVHHLCAAT